MFKKKKCLNCKEKVGNKYEFCPHCGHPFNKSNQNTGNEEDWGMLGRDDMIPKTAGNNLGLPMGFNTLFNTLMKSLTKQFSELDKEMQKEMKQQNSSKHQKNPGVSISISTMGNMPPKIRVNSFGDKQKIPYQQTSQPKKQQIKEISLHNISQDKLRKISKLPKQEPKTSVRRLADKVIYEIKMPGVKSIEDVSINRFENSIEIKALAKSKAYFKIISISLPIINYELDKGSLFLELRN